MSVLACKIQERFNDCEMVFPAATSVMFSTQSWDKGCLLWEMLPTGTERDGQASTTGCPGPAAAAPQSWWVVTGENLTLELILPPENLSLNRAYFLQGRECIVVLRIRKCKGGQ